MPAPAANFGPLRWPVWIAALRRELTPFPGRDLTVFRLVIVVALVTVISMTLQVPQLPLSAFFVFFVTKENRVLTAITGVMMIIGATIAMSCSLFLYRYTFDYPEVRVPVMAGLIFTGMFLSRVFFLGPLGFVIGFFAALTQTTAESAPNTDVLVRGLLWLWVALIYPIVLTVIINQILLPAHPWDALVRGLNARLEAAAAALRRMLDTGVAGGRTDNPALLELATRGSSGLINALKFSETQDPALLRRHASLISAIAAGENMAATTAALEFRPPIAMAEDDRLCAEALLLEIVRLKNALPKRELVWPPENTVEVTATIPHLRDLQFAVKCFHNSLVGGNPVGGAPPPKHTRPPLFVADAFTNPVHFRFALKVTLAAMLCYFIYTGLAWPGISTAFVTCCFIALGSTGATMRKGWLRILGCSLGGLAGFLCILWLIPHMESIVSLVLLTAAGTFLAGWVAVGGDRSSYAGLQAAFAFFMCIFQGFAPETNFTVIRDRVVGILLGIVVSTVIFHHLWPERAIDGLRHTLARVLRNLSRLLVLLQINSPLETPGKDLDKIRAEITRGLDSTLSLSELMIYEQLTSDTCAVFSPNRLESMVASTQALSLMIMALHGRAKIEEWRRQEPAVQQAEVVLRARAAEYLGQIAAYLEGGKPPDTAALEDAFQSWSERVAFVTGNDRPRLVRRAVGQLKQVC
jgi:multidrug resistance protein MdtO